MTFICEDEGVLLGYNNYYNRPSMKDLILKIATTYPDAEITGDIIESNLGYGGKEQHLYKYSKGILNVTSAILGGYKDGISCPKCGEEAELWEMDCEDEILSLILKSKKTEGVQYGVYCFGCNEEYNAALSEIADCSYKEETITF